MAAAPTAGRSARESQRFLNLMKLSLLDLLYENDPKWRKSAVEGWGWPSRSFSMIGLRRLNNLEHCFEHVLANKVTGDFIETGADIWQQVYDWHVRFQQPISLGRTPEGRYTILLLATTVVMRPDKAPGFIGLPFDNR